jgi:hypothetical protein
MVFKIADTYNYRQLWWLDKLLIGHKGYIAGGCFKNIFNNEQVKDVDIFFENKADCLKAISYYKKEMKEHPNDWRFVYENEKVWSVYSNKEKVRLELVKSTFGKPKKVISEFDFTITKFAYYKNYDNVDEENYMAVFEIIFHEDFFEHLHTKRLVIDDEMIYPVSTFNRVMRYARYGYQPCRETKIKIVTNLAMLDPKNQKDFEKELGKSLYDGLD